MPDSLILLQHALLFAFEVSIVLSLAAGCAGIAVSLVLSVFQIQDQTLPFAVKLLVVGAAVAITSRAAGAELLSLIDRAFELASVARP
ncbi:EscS/YscS/HrcS family type III secretion system export apparatus protein [Trinickia dabaoshanensis]|uniref:EscS/YscS/HrcS family type III secretion system export apparatus protein n=1 Tax=Trinickia dabaoshanensis TaxID=564714 RepID=A0A2N7VTE6_9BURK|nr:flagellar biosynthetic protein FliQ [Trinickia dabaoshanensis]PMS20426.1 EscS/YscS/HrcS family type III secretion system export apparatus protein [Trinickia dabaoshanensis]